MSDGGKEWEMRSKRPQESGSVGAHHEDLGFSSKQDVKSLEVLSREVTV